MKEEDLLEAILNGTERIWRFSEQEQVGSSITADRFLWLSILRAESELASSITGVDDGVRLRFYNSDYYISDLQPGRNTVVDADTGEVRFIDPRITLNDPNGPMTSVSHLGKRREDLPNPSTAVDLDLPPWPSSFAFTYCPD